MEELDEHVDQAADIFTSIKDTGYDVVMNHGPRVLMVIVLLVVGLWIIKRIESGLRKVMTRRKLDPSLIPFVVTMLDISLKVLLIISLAGVLGFPTTSFVAILGAAGLAVGLALQGTLANFAGGVLILIFKPFRVGDLIEAQGEKGNVKEIQIFVTIINTPENKTVIIPNGAISNGNITNYTVEGVIRVDMTFGVSYDSDIKKTKEVLLTILQNHPKTLKEPAPFVGVSALADSSVNFAVRPYTHPNDYWDVYFDVYEAGKIALDEAGITIPFPQVDVHMKPNA
jgi:small conductance mechanosensitive channel